MAYRDDVTWTKEHMRLAKLNPVFTSIREPRSADNDEHRVVIDLQFRSLMGAVRILDRQVMETECMLNMG